MGMLALVGGRFSVTPATPVSTVEAKEATILGESERKPFFLEKYSEPQQNKESANLFAWHSSHVSHASHSSHSSHVSHRSHTSHYSGY